MAIAASVDVAFPRSCLPGHPLRSPTIEISAGTSSVRTRKASSTSPTVMAKASSRKERSGTIGRGGEGEGEHDAGDRDRDRGRGASAADGYRLTQRPAPGLLQMRPVRKTL